MMPDQSLPQERDGRPHVVIVGGGFGGLAVARGLCDEPVRITLVDRSNHHLFQPLLYQVATAMLAPAEIATPLRQILREQANAAVLLAEVTGVDEPCRTVTVRTPSGESRELVYDYLVLATGARHSFFGHHEFAEYSHGLKSLPDALTIRDAILRAFETAELERDPKVQRELLTFILVGAGPTGVEMAGAIAELRRFTLRRDFRHIDPRQARILLVEAAPRILLSFPDDLARRAQRRLEELGVQVRTGSPVECIDAGGVIVGGERIGSRTVIWTAGVEASPAGRWLNAPTDRAGRVRVGSDCSVPGRPSNFVIGDTASFEQDGKPLPGVAQVALQQGRHVATVIASRVHGKPAPPPFRYRNLGNLAIVGRGYAILDRGRRRMAGFTAWLIWALVHIAQLAAFMNRLRVMVQWAWAYFTRQHGSRLILEPRPKQAVQPGTSPYASDARPRAASEPASDSCAATGRAEPNSVAFDGRRA
jgi:NADH dehydrogenase FAD-containing subunit